ncbi:gene transfer agent family protein [Sphingomonas xinjiangensis]|uniref:Gene transfer agent family protein n=1 Tax=Sphingomonas xinjiangensis TaxID=643568 RepID=A0A840YBE1_9SPHN|nr:gene transfer agent family protein [Sphingomonas xinjiangensis]MBB5709349.1 hypothetical protein [Sphingomonas xinjiangensis]
MDTAVTLAFGDGSYTFWLPMARIVEVERLCGDKSIVAMFEEFGAAIGLERDTDVARFMGFGSARIKDVYEVIRCAAIGGGASPIDAKNLVDNYVDGRPYAETVPVAWAILNAAVMGVSLKKKAPEAEPNDMSRSEREPSSSTATTSA